MTFLLDTHVWLWMLADPDRLGALRGPLEDEATTLLLSAVSSWEIAIKHAAGRLTLPEPPATYLPSRIRATGVTPIAIEHAHAVTAGSLPPHHRDPFDRLLVAQAMRMDVPIATADAALEPYGVRLLRP